MSIKANFELMAAYNHCMNNSIYEAASPLSDPDLAKDRGAFFSSILGTLNHILVGDTIWLKRFANHEIEFRSLEYVQCLKHPGSLDAILYSEFDALTQARKKLDGVIVDFTNELTEDVFSKPLAYTNTMGQPFVKNFGQLLQHFFNHQTHHRGQVSTLLNQAGMDIGTTDLLVSIPDE